MLYGAVHLGDSAYLSGGFGLQVIRNPDGLHTSSGFPFDERSRLSISKGGDEERRSLTLQIRPKRHDPVIRGPRSWCRTRLKMGTAEKRDSPPTAPYMGRSSVRPKAKLVVRVVGLMQGEASEARLMPSLFAHKARKKKKRKD